MAIISAGRMASTIDDEVRSQETWPSLKKQLPYSHAPCYRALPDDVEIVAVCDRIEDRCKTFCARWDVPRYYLDYREMIERETPDIVSVATAAELHAEMAVFAMTHGVRGIYCEKAMCCSLDEANRIVTAVRKHGAKFMLGAHRRHHPNFKTARQLIVAGQIGDLVCVTSTMQSSLLHTLSHQVDCALYLAGDDQPMSVNGVLGGTRTMDHVEGRRADDEAYYDPNTGRWSGDPGCLTFTARLAGGVFLIHLPAVTDLRFEALGTEGYLRILDNGDALHMYRRRGRTYSFDEVPLPPMAPASAHVALVRDLIRCLREDKTPLCNEYIARNGMQILLGCAQSHLAGGKTMDLPLNNSSMYVPSY